MAPPPEHPAHDGSLDATVPRTTGTGGFSSQPTRFQKADIAPVMIATRSVMLTVFGVITAARLPSRCT